MALTERKFKPDVAKTDTKTVANMEFKDKRVLLTGASGIHPLGYTGKPDDVARLVGFLAANSNQFITGQTYVIDGGRTAQLSLP